MQIKLYENNGNKTLLPLEKVKIAFPNWRSAAQEQFNIYEKRRREILVELRFNLFTLPDDIVDNEFLGPLTEMDQEVLRLFLKSEASEKLKWIDAQLWRLRSLLYPERKLKPGHITEAEIEAAKWVLCESLIAEREFKKSGVNLYTRCPFHNDRHPSFVIHTGKNLWNCFACNEGGDSIQLYMKLFDVGFIEAVGVLNEARFAA